MTVSATSQATNTQTLASTASTSGSIGADFNMFLKLLTTQMQNQDPLDPMKSSEYTQQLAQYTQVEQTVQQSGTLKEILARLSTQDLAQASGMIGHEAVFDSASAGLGSAPASWSFVPARPVQSLVATITDANGRVVDTKTVDAASANGRFNWNGRLANGKTAASGLYTLALSGTDSSGNPIPVAISTTGIVAAVSQAKGALALVVNGAEMPVSSLRSIAATGG
jgi:flagellar basal-body rod modification protein FlgD